MQAEVKGKTLTVTIEMQTPSLSSSGKNLVIASSAGPNKTTATVNGKPVTVNLTAWIGKD